MHSFQGLCNFRYCLLERKWLNFNIHRNFVQSNYWIFKHVITKARSPKTTTVGRKTQTPRVITLEMARRASSALEEIQNNYEQRSDSFFNTFNHIVWRCRFIDAFTFPHFSALFYFYEDLWVPTKLYIAIRCTLLHL